VERVTPLAGASTVILLTLRDLQHRAIRFVVVTVLGSVVFALLFVMTGLVEQFHREPVSTVDAFGASTWVIPEGVSGPFTAVSAMSAADAAAVTADAAGAAAPTVVSRASLTTGDESDEVILVGHVAGGLGSPPTVDGRAATAPGEIVVDTTTGADVGEQVQVAGRPFEVVGRSSDTTLLAGIPLVFVVLSDAQQLVYRSDEVVSAVLVDGDVASMPDGFVIMTRDDIIDDAFGPLESAVASVDLVRALLWIVAAVIIGSVVYLSALERQRDFAVLKAVGVSNRSLLGGLALQAVLVALGAVAIAIVLQLFLAPTFPLKVRVPARAFVTVPLFATVLALVAGAAGMRRVARSDPALAFSGAGG
jgi:putative ABC transport system permease protein